MAARTTLLDPADALVGMIDIQENHYKSIPDGGPVLDRMIRFVRAARVLDVPIVWTEHHPRAFGPTLPPMREALAGLEPIAKRSFGCFGEPRFAEAVAASKRRTLVLVGAETHICIQQTALGALERGMGVVLVADALTARTPTDHEIALRRLELAGAVPASWEAVVYEWMRGADHPKFKQVLPIVKGS
jgi:nicotinamidase-related amidase